MTDRINLKKSVLWVVAAMLLVSCSDWTETESLKIKYPELKKDNPELYEAYNKSLREYRGTDHKVVICKFDNKEQAPAGQGEHINALPDSVDYVILMAPDAISAAIQSEMIEVRKDKGMKVLYEVNYSDMISDYKAYAEWWRANHPDADDSGTEEDGEAETEETVPSNPVDTLISQNNYVKNAVTERLRYFDEYGFDGISVLYTGVNPLSVSDENHDAYCASYESFIGGIRTWRENHTDAQFFIEGTPQYFLDTDASLVKGADYIIIPAESEQNSYSYSYLVNQALRFGNIPADRFIIGVTTVSLTDPGDTDGTFLEKDDNGAQLTAITGAAYWVSQKTSGITKAGICISKAQNDYYNIKFVYPNIRKAISIMNPSPLN